MKDPHPDYYINHWLVYSKEKTIIGWARSYVSKETHPSYDTNKHIADCDTVILKEQRRKGLGTKLLHKHLDVVKKYQRTIIQSVTLEESGHNF